MLAQELNTDRALGYSLNQLVYGTVKHMVVNNRQERVILCFVHRQSGRILRGIRLGLGRWRTAGLYRLPVREEIFEHLGKHPKILSCYGLEEAHHEVHSLLLELVLLGNVQQFMIELANDTPPLEHTSLQNDFDGITDLSHVHSRKAQHAGLSCRKSHPLWQRACQNWWLLCIGYWTSRFWCRCLREDSVWVVLSDKRFQPPACHDKKEVFLSKVRDM